MNKKNFRQTLKNISKQGGFSLVELMIAVGIGTVVSAGVAAVFVFAIEQFTVLVEQNAAEESLLWAAYNTRSFLTQAIDLQVDAGPIAGNIPAGGKGKILTQFDSGNDGQIKTLAVFSREMNAGTGSSTFYSTGIFFINPRSDAPVGSADQPWGGVLIFDMGTAGGTSTMWPGMDDLWFDRISDFHIQNMECAIPGAIGAACTGSNAKSATVTIKARYFKNAKKEQWFYATPTAGNIQAPYRDIEMTVKVGFRDNVLLDAANSRVGSSTDERLHGGIYFFRMVLPPLNM